MDEATAKAQLESRTRLRNQSMWVLLDWGGLLNPLAPLQAAMDTLSRAAVESPMAISNESWRIKESQRDRTAALSQQEIAQEQQIAEAKVATGRAKLAIQRTTDEYVLAAKVYDAKVKALIMRAKEYAAQVELEQLAVEESRTSLAIAKEELHLKQVNAQIYYEFIQQAQVEADLARAQVDIAKAHVRAVMANIEAGRADIEVIEAKIQQYIAEADKATLQADVASIYAEILTKTLSTIKLDVGQKEIAAGFKYIQSHLEDMLVLWGTREVMEEIRTEGEAEIQNEITMALTADEAQEDLREAETVKDQAVFDYDKTQTGAELQREQSLQDTLTSIKQALLDRRLNNTIQRDAKDTWAQKLIFNAQAGVNYHRTVNRTVIAADNTILTID